LALVYVHLFVKSLETEAEFGQRWQQRLYCRV